MEIITYSPHHRAELNTWLEQLWGILQRKGISPEKSSLLTAIIGELGNNVFDHNFGSIPTCTITLTIAHTEVTIIVADMGQGFVASMSDYQRYSHEMDAIADALHPGISGRTRERRGLGLATVRKWVFEVFHGKWSIASKNGAVFIENGTKISYQGNPIVGVVITCYCNL